MPNRKSNSIHHKRLEGHNSTDDQPLSDVGTTDWTAFSQASSRVKDPWKDEWPRLAQQIEPGRTAGPIQVVQWVFDNAGTPPKMLEASDVPSLGALRYLRHVQASENYYADFTRNIWAKIIPDKRQIENEARFEDNGHKLLALLDQFDEEFAAQEAERSKERTA